MANRNRPTRERGCQCREVAGSWLSLPLGTLSLTLQPAPRRPSGLQQQEKSPGREVMAFGKERRPGQGTLAASTPWTEREPPAVLIIRPWITEPPCGLQKVKGICDRLFTLASFLWWIMQTESFNLCATLSFHAFCLWET